MADAGRQRVLVVEDDMEMRERILVPGLECKGFDVHGVGSAMEMYRSLLARPAHLVVLDVGLPDEDGFSTARHLRETTRAGIVMLTGRRSSRDRIRGLDEGADAYLAKPVDLDLLVATVRSVLRRIAAERDAAPAPPAPGRWEVAADGWHLVSPAGARVLLSHAERVVIDCLAQSRGTAVPREELIARLVDAVEDFDPHRLEMLVHRLRRKVLSETGERLPLGTVRGIGYVLVPG
jgi:two-component system, OmpR family, response regulator PhoP